MSQDTWNHIAQYKDRFIDGDAVAIIWTIEDVLSMADDNEMELSVDEAAEVLARCYHGHDCGYGFTWDLIQHHLYDFVQERDYGLLMYPPEPPERDPFEGQL